MTTLEWASDSESDDDSVTSVDEPRKLKQEDIENIVTSLRFSVTHNPVQENIIYIHREKTRRKLAKTIIRPSKIPELKKIILQQFYTSVIAPGEAVGVNAAQCIGEPTTQLTLNSVSPDERIIIQEHDGTTRLVTIGTWIDVLLGDNESKIQHIPKNRTEYLELPLPVWSPTPTKNGQLEWNRVTAVTKHLPVGDLVQITSRSGRQVTVTKSKSLLVWNGTELVQKGGSEVKIDDLVPVIADFPDAPIQTTHLNLTTNLITAGFHRKAENILLNEKLGQKVGIYIANSDPKFDENTTPWFFKQWLGTGHKRVPQEAYTAPISFAKGILDTVFVLAGTEESDDGLVVSLESEDLIIGVGVLCSRFGMVGNKSYEQGIHTYTIVGIRAVKWADTIGYYDKANFLRTNISNYFNEFNCKQENVILDPIVKIETIPATEFVYDLTVPDTLNFSIWNGLCVADTFHDAGISEKNVTLGFPRARELFNATKSPSNPTCTIYFTRDNETPQALHKVADKFPEAIVDDLLVEWKVFEPDDHQFNYWHTAWFKLNPNFGEITEDDWCLRLRFNVRKLYKYDVTIKDIATRLLGTYTDIRCIPSPLNLGMIDILVACVDINNENDTNNIEITDDYTARNYYMHKIISPKVRATVICGISGITKIYQRKAKCDESYGEYPLKPEIADRLDNDEEWIVDTDGTNLKEIITQDGVDSYRTLSNDMWEISKICGIEAARTYLYIEFLNIVNSGGTIINPVHIQVLVDKMTYTGSIRAIARFGVETSQYDPIARATFEEVMSQIQTSAMFSEKDHLNGISSNIVLGTKINAGTGRIELRDIPLKVIPNCTSHKHASGREKIRPPESQTIKPKKIITEDI
uniref:DNA-directed RNA polymerase n=1 Tax=Marseillevirus LCMAC201 TaxID=2506605 RepID=A0A481YX00_9VIRU|nr:MAG: DNA-directed RNA polymerase subunit alpha [Marseillevirus LCMAC201]